MRKTEVITDPLLEEVDDKAVNLILEDSDFEKVEINLPTMEATILANSTEEAKEEPKQAEPEPEAQTQQSPYDIKFSEFIAEFGVEAVAGFAQNLAVLDMETVLKLLSEGKITKENYELLAEISENQKKAFEIPDFVENEFKESLALTMQKKALEANIKPETRLMIATTGIIGYLGWNVIQTRKENSLLMKQLLEGIEPKTKSKRPKPNRKRDE